MTGEIFSCEPVACRDHTQRTLKIRCDNDGQEYLARLAVDITPPQHEVHESELLGKRVSFNASGKSDARDVRLR